MLCKNCKTELPSGAKFCLECGAPVPKQTGLQIDQKADIVKGDAAGLIVADGAMTSGFNAGVSQDVGKIESGGTLVGAVIGGLGGNVHVGGQQQYGDKIEVGNVSGKGIAIGRDAQAAVTDGVSVEELAKLFAAVYQQIGDRPEDPDVDKGEIAESVQKIEREASMGEEANPNKVERWLKTLATAAPDILEVTTACLLNPAAGVAAVIKKVAEKARTEAAVA
ncbi:MAG: zinc-ribbon domain-containing protein [Anaerolineae bacterium]|jgi:hypothetical protein